MRRRSWKRLAGCIGIDLALAGFACAAEFKAGVASAGTVRALAIADARGMRMVVAQAEFPITTAVADLVAANVIKNHELDRAGILLRWSGIGLRPANVDDLLDAIGQALNAMDAAVVRYAHRGISVTVDGGDRCLASVGPDGNLGLDSCWKDGVEVAGAIRGAFQMVEPSHGLQRRGEAIRSYPVQAIAIGNAVTILAMSGEASVPEGVSPRGLIFAPFSNEASAPPKDVRVTAAVRSVMLRTK